MKQNFLLKFSGMNYDSLNYGISSMYSTMGTTWLNIIQSIKNEKK